MFNLFPDVSLLASLLGLLHQHPSVKVEVLRAVGPLVELFLLVHAPVDPVGEAQGRAHLFWLHSLLHGSPLGKQSVLTVRALSKDEVGQVQLPKSLQGLEEVFFSDGDPAPSVLDEALEVLEVLVGDPSALVL